MIKANPIRQYSVDTLAVCVYRNRALMGAAAADYVATHLQDLLSRQDEVRIVVGSAPSQDEFFDNLTSVENKKKVDWARVVVFHMDEYVGIAADHPQSFRSYQSKHLLSKVNVKDFHPIRGEANDLSAECKRLTELLTQTPIDVVCLGIGENGHLAFNDPPADFDDSEWVKVVRLDSKCRQQQVNDGCFADINQVPTHAITLSLRVFQSAAMLSGVVPAKSKAQAVAATLEGPVTRDCPATMLRSHPNARIFLDPESASLLESSGTLASD